MTRMHAAHMPKLFGFQDTTQLDGTRNYHIRYWAGAVSRGATSMAPTDDVDSAAHAAAQAAADITGVIVQYATANRGWSSVLPRRGA